MKHIFFLLLYYRQASAKESGNLPGLEKMMPLPPNYYNFEF